VLSPAASCDHEADETDAEQHERRRLGTMLKCS
jgi:hypothetical protein